MRPYTEGGIEKSEVVLLDFAKTKVIQAGGADYDMVELTFDPLLPGVLRLPGVKAPGGGYVLEAGQGYKLYVSRNAHDRAMEIPFRVDADIFFNEGRGGGAMRLKTALTM